MVKRLGHPQALPTGFTVRPMTEVEYGPWLGRKIDEWTEQVSESGLATAEEAQLQSVETFREMLPEGLASPGYTWLCLDTDTDTAVATIWLKPQFAPAMSWVYSVETRPELRGRGYGYAAMLAGERATLEAGDTHLGLNVRPQHRGDPPLRPYELRRRGTGPHDLILNRVLLDRTCWRQRGIETGHRFRKGSDANGAPGRDVARWRRTGWPAPPGTGRRSCGRSGSGWPRPSWG